MITQQTIQQIVSRIDVVEVVGEFVKLKKRGANYMGLCPFHNEKSPSFTVSPAKEIYKCFGCGKSGNSISFLMEHEKLSYADALRWLARKYNVEVEETQVSPEYQLQQQTADSLFIINKFAREFFEDQLFNTDDGRDIGLSYLLHRGFTEATIKKFQLGYNPAQWDTFTKTALEKQYNKDYLLQSGLVGERDGRMFDMYRDRVIFPIHNNTGKIIGFGARLIKKNDKAPKYINTPENELYVKSKVLYGIYFARQAMDKLDECLLVEGYTDVVSLSQAGVENVVASGGTSLTQDQLRLIKKYTNNLTIIYDGDGAGVKAALRGLDMALEEGLNVHLVLIPDNEDPDSYVNKVGKEAFTEFIRQNKKDFILFQLEVALAEAGNDSTKKSGIVNRIAESLSKINKAEDFTKQQDYIRRSSEMLQIDEQGLTNLVNKFIRERVTRFEKKAEEQAPLLPDDAASQPDETLDDSLNLLIKNELQERAVVKCLLMYGGKTLEDGQLAADYILTTLHDFHFDNNLLERIAETYRNWHEAGMAPNEKSFLYYDDKEMVAMVVSLLEYPYELSPKWDEIMEGMNITTRDNSREDVLQSVNYFKLRKLKQMLDENQKELKEAQTFEAQMRHISIHAELKTIERQITEALGTVILR